MFNHCPKCKSDKIEFVSQQYFYCSDCQFSYYHNVAAAAAAIITVNNEVLLTQRAKAPGKGKLDLPGGFVEPNESVEQALSREVSEELNVQINQWQYVSALPNTYTYNNITYSTLDCIFSCNLASKPKIVVQPDEISNYIWVDLSSFDLDKLAFNSIKNALKSYRESLSN